MTIDPDALESLLVKATAKSCVGDDVPPGDSLPLRSGPEQRSPNYLRLFFGDEQGPGRTVAQWVLPADADLIVAAVNALPELLAVYRAAKLIRRGCDCEYDHRCGRCQSVLDLQATIDRTRSSKP